MNTLLIFILILVTAGFLFDKILDHLNIRNFSRELPPEAEGIFDAEKYRRSQEYYKTNHNFSALYGALGFLAMMAILATGGFGWLDSMISNHYTDPYLRALVFFGVLGLASDLAGLPFSIYRTFVIEEKFGFNKTRPLTFVFDKLKGYLLAAIVGGGMLFLIMWIWQNTGEYFWILAWAVIAFFTLFITMFYTSVLVPVFNKLTPLPEGPLRTAIEAYCRQEGFKLKNLFVIDGSKRSSKANAYFSGLGARKTIVLYDTLIEKHTVEEVVSVLAHEVGHYKKKHTLTGSLIGIAQTGVSCLYVLGTLPWPEPWAQNRAAFIWISWPSGFYILLSPRSPVSFQTSFHENMSLKRTHTREPPIAVRRCVRPCGNYLLTI